MMEKQAGEGKTLDQIPFSDIYLTPEKVAYIHDRESRWGLKTINPVDLKDFHKALQEAYTKNSSYSLFYKGSIYRVERIMTLTGIHYSARRMPQPDSLQAGWHRTDDRPILRGERLPHRRPHPEPLWRTGSAFRQHPHPA